MTTPDRRSLWAVLLLALAVRLALIAVTPDYHPFGDPHDYDELARSLVDHGHYTATSFAAIGTPSAFRPPAYPYLLAGVYGVFGKSWLAGRIAGALLGTATVFLLWDLVRRVAGSELARWAALVAALAPSLAWMSDGLVAETLFLPLLLASVLMVVRHREQPAWRWPLLAGLLVGALTMTRTNGIVVVVPLLAGAWLVRHRWRDGGLVLAGLVLALAPWTIRNAIVLDTFAPLGTQSGITMAGVFNQGATTSAYYGIWRPPGKIAALRRYTRRPDIDEAQLDRRMRHFAIDFAKDHPSYVLHVTWHHLQQMLELRDVRITGSNSQREQGIPVGFARKTSRGGGLLLMLLALAGACTAVARRTLWRRELLWLWAVPVVLLLTLAPLVTGPRYRLPLDPFLCVFAGCAAMTAWRAISPRLRGHGRPALAPPAR